MMKHSLAWIEKFIASDKQNEVARLSPERRFDILCRMIEGGQIEISNYLSWASQLFLLPSLDSSFFSNVDIKPVWQKYSPLNNWSPEILPVGDWENRLMIACVSPPNEFKMSLAQAPIFVLASPLDLRRTWILLNAKPAVAEAVPAQIKPNLTPAQSENIEGTVTRFELKMDPEFKPIELDSAQNDDAVTATAPPTSNPEAQAVKESETPSGFTIDINITNSGVAPSFNFAPPKNETNIITETPVDVLSSEIKFDLDTPPLVVAAALTEPVVLSPPPPPPPPPPKTRTSTVPLPKAELLKKQVASPLVQANPAGSPTQNKPIGPPPRGILSAVATPFKVNTPNPVTAETSQIPKATSGKLALKRSVESAKSSFDECSSYEDISDLMFTKMRSLFEMSMLLRCDENGLTPIHWTGAFKGVDEQKASTIVLQQPSIFRVVYSSGKPYHGYVVANATNSKFFAEWNANEIPKHVTIFPVFVEKTFVAMWFGATNKAIDLKVSMADMDSYTDASVAALHKALKLAA